FVPAPESSWGHSAYRSPSRVFFLVAIAESHGKPSTIPSMLLVHSVAMPRQESFLAGAAVRKRSPCKRLLRILGACDGQARLTRTKPGALTRCPCRCLR